MSSNTLEYTFGAQGWNPIPYYFQEFVFFIIYGVVEIVH